MIVNFNCKKCSNVLSYYSNEKCTYVCVCKYCGYINRILDISYDDEISAPLSNLFPHKFVIDGVKCQSMESFIQSLRVEDVDVQRKICEEYSGYMAYKMRLALPDWTEKEIVYWQNKKIIREFEEYDKLITRAYDMLFENEVFRYFLNIAKDYVLIYNIGGKSIDKTLLTQDEYIGQLNRLIKKL